MNTDSQEKGSSIIDDLFLKHGWHLVVNDDTRLCYTKEGDETTTFEIEVTSKTVRVRVPLHHSVYQYTTTFDSYLAASEYLAKRFHDYLLEERASTP